MLPRVLLIAVAVFWVVMNLLLWRSEFRPEGEPGERIPVKLVVEKILRSPDLSSLEIRQRGKRIGQARLIANQTETYATGLQSSETAALEGEVRRLTGYTLDFDGSIFGEDRTNRYRFFVGLQVSTNLDWHTFSLSVSRHPNTVSLMANATNQTLAATYKDGDFQTQHEFTFEQLRNPKQLATDLGGPLAGVLLNGASAALPAGWQNPGQFSQVIQWEARNDKLKISQGQARVFRLEAPLGERQKITIIVSRVGEILKIELPHGITLINDEARL